MFLRPSMLQIKVSSEMMVKLVQYHERISQCVTAQN
jgi:hypothetical protein